MSKRWWKNDRPYGMGIRIYRNGNLYEGRFEGFKANGYGV